MLIEASATTLHRAEECRSSITENQPPDDQVVWHHPELPTVITLAWVVTKHPPPVTFSMAQALDHAQIRSLRVLQENDIPLPKFRALSHDPPLPISYCWLHRRTDNTDSGERQHLAILPGADSPPER